MGLETVEEEGEAAFYGPKLDFMVRDALGREWQLGTVQVDYTLPKRFDLTYVDENDERVRPVMIHRAPFGSLERFIGVLIEHTGGSFPLWLAPTQVKVLPITDDQNDYAEAVARDLRRSGLRVETDTRSEKVGRKIRDAEVEKVPVMLVVGRKEAEAGTVSVRRHGLGDESDQGHAAGRRAPPVAPRRGRGADGPGLSRWRAGPPAGLHDLRPVRDRPLRAEEDGPLRRAHGREHDGLARPARVRHGDDLPAHEPVRPVVFSVIRVSASRRTPPEVDHEPERVAVARGLDDGPDAEVEGGKVHDGGAGAGS